LEILSDNGSLLLEAKSSLVQAIARQKRNFTFTLGADSSFIYLIDRNDPRTNNGVLSIEVGPFSDPNLDDAWLPSFCRSQYLTLPEKGKKLYSTRWKALVADYSTKASSMELSVTWNEYFP